VVVTAVPPATSWSIEAQPDKRATNKLARITMKTLVPKLITGWITIVVLSAVTTTLQAFWGYSWKPLQGGSYVVCRSADDSPECHQDVNNKRCLTRDGRDGTCTTGTYGCPCVAP
jgi:hypothetical protein